MTCIAVIKHKEKIWLASDSLWAAGSQKETGTDDYCKIIDYPYFSIAISGTAAIRDAAEEIKPKHKKTRIKTKQDARDFARDLYAQFKVIGEDAIEKESGENTMFLIATPKKAFHVERSLACFEVTKFESNWGELKAMLMVLWDKLESKQLLEESMGALIEMYPGHCGYPLDLRLLTK